jgi:Na+/H+ antiporter NhaA
MESSTAAAASETSAGGISEGAGGRTAWARNLGAPIRDFLSAETGGSVVLIAAVLAALVWSNSPWPHSYDSFWQTKLTIAIGHSSISADLRHWVNQGLMTLFFLVVGLEAKRELDLGELRERSRIGVPIVASIGGMVLAVGVYLLFNAGRAGADGWGAAMSTDTALALGVLALVGPSWATRLRVFLLTVVVIDDLCALLVIGIAYTNSVSLMALAVAVALFAVLVSLRWAGRWRGPAAAIVGVAIWVAMFKSGIDPVIVGLAIGLVTSAYPPARDDLDRATELTRSFREQPTPALAYTAQRGLTSAISANERLQFRLHPWTSFVVVPLFALANAGIHIDGHLISSAVSSPVTLGIFAAYVLGKPLGIITASWLATRRVFGGTRLTVTWPGLTAMGAAAGVGFTVSLLIASLAFTGQTLDQAKLGVLAAALASTLLAWIVFQVIAHLPEGVMARQFGRTAEAIIDLADEVDPERDHVRGSSEAPVTLVEYADFECPYCGQAEPTIRELLGSCDDQLRYVFRHLPLSDVHPRAQLAAEAAEAAAAQGAFWEMHDLLFENQEHLTAMDLRRFAEQLGLDVERFSEEVHHGQHKFRVTEDVASADASGVSGTPSFFINGRRHHGVYDIDTLTRAVHTARIAAGARAQ